MRANSAITKPFIHFLSWACNDGHYYRPRIEALLVLVTLQSSVTFVSATDPVWIPLNDNSNHQAQGARINNIIWKHLNTNSNKYYFVLRVIVLSWKFVKLGWKGLSVKWYLQGVILLFIVISQLGNMLN